MGVAVSGSGGGLFVIGSDGVWTFDPNSEFDNLSGEQTATTSVAYHVSDGNSVDEGVLTITVTAYLAPDAIHRYPFSSGFVDTVGALGFTNFGLTNLNGDVYGNGYNQYAYAQLNQNIDEFFSYSVWASRYNTFQHYQYIFGCKNISTTAGSNYGWFISLVGNKIAQVSSVIVQAEEALNSPFHLVACVNSIQKLLKLYRNGELVYNGGLVCGTIDAANLNIFTVCGFSGFTSTYARAAKVHSVDIYAGELTQAQISNIYDAGIL